MKATTTDAYKLLHDGSVALSQVERNGMRIDVPYIEKAIEETYQRISRLTNRMSKQDIGKTWKKTFGDRFNIDSRQQLGKVIFTVMNIPCSEYTEKGRPRVTEETLKATKLPFVKDYLKIQKLKKAKNTYLKGILRESVDGYIHPFFNLHIVVTYRSSSDHPNFQNIPVRNPRIKKLVRQAFIPTELPIHIVFEGPVGFEYIEAPV